MTDRVRPSGTSAHGSLAEEAAKLAELAQQWLGQRSSASTGTADVWGEATAVGEPPECRTCPICRARQMVGDLNPDVVDNLSAAAASLLAAARAMGGPGRPAGPAGPSAQTGTTRRT